MLKPPAIHRTDLSAAVCYSDVACLFADALLMCGDQMYLLIGIISIGQIDSFAIENAIVAARNRIPSWQCDYTYEVEGKKESNVHGSIYWRKDHVRYDVIRDSDHQYDFMAIFTPQFYLKIFSFGPGRSTNLIIERPVDIDKSLNPDTKILDV